MVLFIGLLSCGLIMVALYYIMEYGEDIVLAIFSIPFWILTSPYWAYKGLKKYYESHQL